MTGRSPPSLVPPVARLCPCCGKGLTVFKEVFQTIRGEHARTVRACMGCRIKVVVHRMRGAR